MANKNIPDPLIWILDPLVSVGPIRFGIPAEPIIHQYNLYKLSPPFEDADWETYEFPNEEVRIFVEDALVESVGCYDYLFYRNINIIGATLDDVQKILGNPDAIGETDEIGTPIEYDFLGLSLFMQDGIITGCICHGPIDD